ncbi:MAG: divalent metal cation transporter [Haliea sp.]|jgi:NRAMP (natural resistance-associated macrophage protein)-like metal ion transporter|nr:divalent metal cation transporter [Haliea sp.]
MKRAGPGLLVMAAFIGPGTVTTASKAGAEYGFALMWALLFSVLATLVLQEMAARLGLVTGRGLSQALRSSFESRFFTGMAVVLVVLAIGFGNAAYESGNISGASMGLAAITPWSTNIWALVVGGIAFSLLASGRYRVVERGLVILVVVMSAVFLATMLMVGPDLMAMAGGLTRPSLPAGSTLTVMALIGTTVVPYNLFLHSSAVREKWPESVPVDEALRESRRDSVLSIGLGGLITLSIVTTAAAAFFGTDIAFSAATISQQLEPLLGPAAKYFFAIGLLAAGLTSAITSPLAAAYAVSGALGWQADLSNRRFKIIWMLVLGSGMLAAALGTRPISAIMFAQAANGFLLPVVAVYLLYVMNSRRLLGDFRNRWRSNIVGVTVVVVVSGLGIFKLLQVFGLVG